MPPTAAGCRERAQTLSQGQVEGKDWRGMGVLLPPTPEFTAQVPIKKEIAKVTEVCVVAGGLLSLGKCP